MFFLRPAGSENNVLLCLAFPGNLENIGITRSQFGQDRWTASESCLENKAKDSRGAAAYGHDKFKTGGLPVEARVS